jgi:hypothetical protein
MAQDRSDTLPDGQSICDALNMSIIKTKTFELAVYENGDILLT